MNKGKNNFVAKWGSLEIKMWFIQSLYLIASELNAFSGQNIVPGRVRNIRTNETVLAHQEDVYTALVVHKSDHHHKDL